MKRIRDQGGSSDAVVARTARLFASVEPIAPSDIEMERVWRKLRSRPRSSAKLRLRLAVALVIFFGMMAVASAMIGRRWIQEKIGWWKVDGSGSSVVVPRATVPAAREIAPAELVVIPVPPTELPAPANPREHKRSKTHNDSQAPIPLVHHREEIPAVQSPLKPRRVLPNEAPILPAR